MSDYLVEIRIAGFIAVVAAVFGASYLSVRWWQRRTRRKALLARLERVAYEAAHAVLVPDGMGGFFHVDHLLMTSRGILVLDTRSVSGVIFGGDQMTEWTVMSRKRRFTFDNPQPALYDRVAAVKQLAGDVPVEGRLLFSNIGKFTKGVPKWVLMLGDLEVEFPVVNRGNRTAPQFAGLEAAWQRLLSQLKPSPHAFTNM